MDQSRFELPFPIDGCEPPQVGARVKMRVPGDDPGLDRVFEVVKVTEMPGEYLIELEPR